MDPADRPLSPALQIYRPQLTSALSITHRITGVALCLGAPALVAWLCAIAAGPATYAGIHDTVASGPGLALLLGWTFSMFFHLCNGVRHLFWDAGYGFTLRSIYASGWAVIVLSVLLTAAAWRLGSVVKG